MTDCDACNQPAPRVMYRTTCPACMADQMLHDFQVRNPSIDDMRGRLSATEQLVGEGLRDALHDEIRKRLTAMGRSKAAELLLGAAQKIEAQP